MTTFIWPTLTRNAYAKINLTLDVGARRPDGYHQIRSVMQTINLHDTLSASATPDMPGVHLTVLGDQACGVPTDESNIVHRAAVRLQKIAAAKNLVPGNQSGLHLTLHKRIPNQAGLGGGSSDAAAALRLVSELLGLTLSPGRLAEIGATLGADVPFFLTGGTALVEGLGELITPLPSLAPDWPLIIVKPTVGVSTPAAYAALDAQLERPPGTATERWLRGDHAVSNDFEQVILPASAEVAQVYSLLSLTAGGTKSFKPLLCGSGSALFRRTSDESEAAEIAAAVRDALRDNCQIWVTQTRGTSE